MAQEDVTDLLHQRGFRSCWTMVRIENYQLHSVRQRAGASGPRFSRWSKQVFARSVAEALYFIELEHDQVCKVGEVKRIERQVRADAGERSEERRVGKEV